MSRAPGPFRLLRRRARAEVGSLLALALLVAVTAGLSAVVPRVLSATSDEALRGSLASAPPESLEISATTTNDEGVEQLEDVDAQIRDSLTPLLRSALPGGGLGASTGLYETLDLAGDPTREKPSAWLQLRHQPQALDAVRWVEGKPPQMTAGDAELETGTGERVPLLQVALDVRLAEELDLAAGQTIVLEPLEVAPLGDGTTAVRISGLFEPRDRTASTWSYAPLLTTLGQRYGGDGQLEAEYAAALVDDSQLEALAAASPILRYDWHYAAGVSGAESIDADNAAPLLADLESVVARGAFIRGSVASVTGGTDTVSVSSGLVDLLRAHLERSEAASALVALVLAGVLAVALAVLGLACAVVVRRRAAGSALLHARGASRAAVTASLVAEVGSVALPAAAVGAVGAALAGGERAWQASVVLAVLVAAAALILTGVTTWRSVDPVGSVDHGTRGRRSRSTWRTATEIFVVLAAILAVVEVRRRGLGTDGVDPVLVAAPVLVVLAFVVVVLRLLPTMLRHAAASTARGSGLLPFTALARASRQPLSVALPLSTLLLGLGFAVFASGVLTTVSEGQERSAWRDVGADYLLEAEYFQDQDLEALADVGGVEQVVPALRREEASFFDPAGQVTRGNVLIVDAARYADLVDSEVASGVDPADVRRLSDPVDPDAPLPAIATTPARTALAATAGAIDPTASLGRTEVAVTAVPSTFPLDGGRGLVVLDLPSVQARESFPIRPNTLLVKASPEAAPALAEAAGRLEQRVSLTGRRDVLRDLADSPFVGSTQALFAAGVVAAAGYCVLALVLVLVLGARSRARLASTLRMLGATPRQLSRLAVLEVAPLLAVMVAAGAAAGVLLVVLLLPGLQLQPLTGGDSPPETVLGLLRIGGLVAGLTTLVVVTVVAVSAVERRRGLGETLREGDEP